MKKPPTPHDEAARLQALVSYDVLDSDVEQSFDELTELLSSVLKVPVALVSLVDGNRQWFKSHHGLDATETPREVAFCAHAILDDKIFLVGDSHKDDRFADNPLVTGAPHVRFYAGAPLITPEGYRIGTVCGIDHKPHALDPTQRRFLEIVARQVVSLLELRKTLARQESLLKEKGRSLARSEAINKEIQDLVSVISHDLRAPVLNLVGFTNEIEAGTKELDGLMARQQHEMPEAVRSGITKIIQDDLFDSLVHMQSSSEQILSRIDSIATLSKHGYCDLEDEVVDLNGLVADTVESHSAIISRLGAEVIVDDLPTLRTKKLPLQVIVENLIANAIRYRTPDRPPRIRISVEPGRRYFELRVTDNGRGIADDDISKIFVMFRRVGKQDTKGNGSGLAYCRAIVNRLGGIIRCESELGRGSTFHVRFPLAAEPAAELLTAAATA
jgi:signal transduction histidine kinase